VGCDEYIPKGHDKFRQIKAASGWRWCLTGSGFGGHFTPIEDTAKEGKKIWGKASLVTCGFRIRAFSF
jgi:hypothetical protein